MAFDWVFRKNTIRYGGVYCKSFGVKPTVQAQRKLHHVEQIKVEIPSTSTFNMFGNNISCNSIFVQMIVRLDPGIYFYKF